jgi:hypothetical protein
MTDLINKNFSRFALKKMKSSWLKLIARHEKWMVSIFACFCLFFSVYYVSYPDFYHSDLFYHSDSETEQSKKIELPILSFEETKKIGFFSSSRYRLSQVPPAFFSDKNKRIFKHLNKSELEDRLLSVIPSHVNEKANELIRPILYLSERYQIDPLWITSIIWTESHFDHTAISPKGAKGLMQLMPRTKAHILKVMKNKNIALLSQFQRSYLEQMADRDFKNNFDLLKYRRKLENLEIGIYYLKRLHRYFGGNVILATVSYNMGPGWTQKRLNLNKSIGVKNTYLKKVRSCYTQMVTQFGIYGLFTYQPKK